VLQHLVAARLPPSPYARYILASTENDLTFRAVAESLGAALHALGRLDDPSAASYSPEEASPILAM
jgi:hypothetical protein